MAVFDDDDRPKKKIAHEIGQDLSLLSVEEIKLRIALMQDEIKRLEADMRKNMPNARPPTGFLKNSGQLRAASVKFYLHLKIRP